MTNIIFKNFLAILAVQVLMLVFVLLPLKTEAALQYVGGAEQAGASAAFNLTLPLGTAANDLVIVTNGHSKGTGNQTTGVTTAGYTHIYARTASDSADASSNVAWKVMGAVPDTTVNCRGSAAATDVALCAVHVWRNVNTSIPFDIASTSATAANTNVPNSPSIVPVTSGAEVISIGVGASLADISEVTAPTGYGNLVSANPASDIGNVLQIGMASKAWGGVGAEDPGVWGGYDAINTGSWNAFTLALRPGAVPSVSTVAASAVSNVSATLNGSVTTAGAKIVNRGFAWGTNSALSGGDTATTSEVGSFDAATFTYGASSLSCATTYYFRAYAANYLGTTTNSILNFSTGACGNTLADGSDPSNSTVAPGAVVTDLDMFTLSTTAGSDTATALTVQLLPTNATTTLSKIEITNDSNLDVCNDINVDNTTSNVLNFTGCSLDISSTPATYKIRITPKTHASMALPATGETLDIIGTTTALTTSNTTVGTDTDSATITVDNDSPDNVSLASTTPGDFQVDINWTNPSDSDLSRIMVVASTSDITHTPTEGGAYSTSTAFGSGYVACYGLQTSCSDDTVTNDTLYYYKIFAMDSNGNFSDAGVTPTGSPELPSNGPPIVALTGFERGVTETTMNGSGTSEWNSGLKRTGNYSFRTNPTTTGTGYMQIRGYGTTTSINTNFKEFAEPTALYTTFYFRAAAFPAGAYEEIFSCLGPTNSYKIAVRINDTGNFRVYGLGGTPSIQTSTQSLALDTWYRFDVLCSVGSNAPYEVSLYDDPGPGASPTLIETLSGTTNQGTDEINRVFIGKRTNRVGNGLDVYFDDLIVGTEGFIGPLEIIPASPTSNGSTMSWTSGGAPQNYTLIDEVPASDADYVLSPTSGNPNVALFGFDSASSLGIEGTIHGVAMRVNRHENSGTPTSDNLMRIYSSGSTMDSNAASNLTTSVTNSGMHSLYDPATGNAWTTEGIDGIEAGLVENTAVAMRLTHLLLEIAFTKGANPPVINQEHYRWRNDDGSETNATYAAAEDTALTNDVYKGDRRRLRVLVKNTGGNAANYNYRLEHSSSSCTVWLEVPTSETNGTHWTMDPAQVSNLSLTTDSDGLTNPGGLSFVEGYFMGSTNETGNMSHAGNKFTELEYSLRSTSNATEGTTYCFRVTNAGAVTNITHGVTPQISVLTPATRPQRGGRGDVESNGNGEAVSGGNQGGGGGGSQGGSGSGGDADSEGGGGGDELGGGGQGGGGGGDLGLKERLHLLATVFEVVLHIFSLR